jgi:hypothetical protein
MNLSLLEALAHLEHQQWTGWTTKLIHNGKSDLIGVCCLPDYENLPITTKLMFAVDASKTILILEANGVDIADRPLAVSFIEQMEYTQFKTWMQYAKKVWSDENIQKWQRQINTDYKDLSESERDLDREWAQKIIDCLPQIT